MNDALAEPSPSCCDVSVCSSDDELLDVQAIRRLAGGDGLALDELIRRHRERIARLVYRLLAWHADDDIDDVVQDVFLAVLRNAAQFDGRSRVSTWLSAITVNRCRSVSRRLKVKLRAMNDWLGRPVGEGVGPDQAAAASDEAACVQRAVARLRPADREVIVFHYLEGASVEEITATLGLSRAAVEVRLHRARKRLREIIEAN